MAESLKPFQSTKTSLPVCNCLPMRTMNLVQPLVCKQYRQENCIKELHRSPTCGLPRQGKIAYSSWSSFARPLGRGHVTSIGFLAHRGPCLKCSSDAARWHFSAAALSTLDICDFKMSMILKKGRRYEEVVTTRLQ